MSQAPFLPVCTVFVHDRASPAPWSYSVLTWYVDGTPYYARHSGQPSSLFLPSWPMAIILNTAMSFWAPDKEVPNPADFPPGGVVMAVDWVRVYEWAA